MFARHVPTSHLNPTARHWAQMSLLSLAHPYLHPSLPVSPSPIRVLVAGDHACLRSSLRTILEMDKHIHVVGEAADDCETVKMADRLRPDVVLMDLEMRCCDDYEAIAEICDRKLANSVVALTIHDNPGELLAAQKAGVNLFLEKGVSSKQLIDSLRHIASES